MVRVPIAWKVISSYAEGCRVGSTAKAAQICTVQVAPRGYSSAKGGVNDQSIRSTVSDAVRALIREQMYVSEWFPVIVVLKQSCVRAPLLFIINIWMLWCDR